jgi:hypothetical protein
LVWRKQNLEGVKTKKNKTKTKTAIKQALPGSKTRTCIPYVLRLPQMPHPPLRQEATPLDKDVRKERKKKDKNKKKEDKKLKIRNKTPTHLLEHHSWLSASPTVFSLRQKAKKK